MKSTIVSVRVPESLARELKEKIKTGHFLDLSEATRSIVRKRWLEWKDPSTYQIKKLRADIKDVIKEKAAKSNEEMLLNELQRIKDILVGKEAGK
jgi:Arc/MetJ-type ribon-helix-helix transcriptional regulator